jgi:hypothetical protein
MIEQKIIDDYKQALKSKDRQKADFLSFIRGEIQNAYIRGGKKELNQQDIIKVLNKQKKKLKQTKEMLLNSNRDKSDLSQIEAEISIIDNYLPEPLADGKLEAVIDKVIKQVGADSPKKMGLVIKEVMSEVGSRAEPSRISKIVKSKLK